MTRVNIMANIYENNIIISGDAESVAKIRALVINKHNEVDFSLVVPMPESEKGILGDSDANVFSLSKAMENRLGKLNPEAFVSECQKRYKETNDIRYNVDCIDRNLIDSQFYDESLSVETIIEKAMNNLIDNSRGVTINTWFMPYMKFATTFNVAMKAEHEDHFLGKDNKTNTSMLNCWTKINWGSKGNAHDTFFHDQENTPEHVEVYFSTRNGKGDEWFESLLPLIQDIKGADIEYSWGDSSCCCGGVLTRCDDGELMTTEMTEEEAMDFLNIDEEDQEMFL